ncbi:MULTISPECIES: hypothetical protein [unclassified Paenibacillus]|uniref:hypothetical protein n=1 Tax=unclassified Paenibacillus TaxID=185978 RepID=UPI0007101AA1|nr:MULTISPECIES: hypothetical protein [unclassified Paenibacillus]KQX51359.1 hypothetical protein ASD40_35290 [Paenibacillus sp. Root444D2]KRE50029.1 hypothetical protein ASG85_21505 [Paenibacillus sp. Soil724D2]
MDQSEVDVSLVREYFRRLAVFLDYLSVGSNYPYIDPVKLINREASINYDDVLEICPNVNKAPNGVTKALCVTHVIWRSIADEGDPIAIEYKDLFKPLIILFQRGGTWHTHHGMLDVSNRYLCFLNDWRNQIADQALDFK